MTKRTRPAHAARGVAHGGQRTWSGRLAPRCPPPGSPRSVGKRQVNGSLPADPEWRIHSVYALTAPTGRNGRSFSLLGEMEVVGEREKGRSVIPIRSGKKLPYLPVAAGSAHSIPNSSFATCRRSAVHLPEGYEPVSAAGFYGSFAATIATDGTREHRGIKHTLFRLSCPVFHPQKEV